MATLAATAAALETNGGFPAARTRTVARRLLEDNILTPGAPGIAVEINESDFALLLLAIASDAPLSKVTKATTELANTVPNGVDVSVMPEAVRPAGRTAFDVLCDIIWDAAHGDGQMKFDVEVVATWPEVAFHAADGIAHFMPPGSLPDHWQSAKQRRSTVIPYVALFLVARNLFGEN
ncbi:hypothetical protein [Mesorhizobium sp. 8]|uniref:hypothetical protein n=1 Tax=Mesorhizobium sp. 8 TaxID=2584466 RepID=UPI001123F21A|nr:hypothetical protein [Mesorhizobium sp. 8]QDB99776.1 hypothetical protein FGU64_04775 [Mesorhizobium sp. 8]